MIQYHSMDRRNDMATVEYRYRVILEPQEEGGYTVLVPALPEVVTEGDTEDDALRLAEDAIRLAVESRRDHGEEIPTETMPHKNGRASVRERRRQYGIISGVHG